MYITKRREQVDIAPFWRRYYAHRGLHNIDAGIPENTIAAFNAAKEAGYGAELDVRLSKDGQVVVFHDDDLKRMCGIDKRVEDLPFDELKNLRISGTDKGLCLFKDVLGVFEGTALPIIVEIKTGDQNDLLCRKTYDLLKDWNGTYCIESFNPMIVRWFKQHAPEVVRGQLSGAENTFRTVRSKLAKQLLTICAFNILNKPDFIAYKLGKRPSRINNLRKKGIMIVGWTSRDPEDSRDDNDALIFESYLPPSKY